MYSEWTFTSEIQREIMASKLAALAFFPLGLKKFANVYVAQLVKVNGEMEWMVVKNAFDTTSIAKALCSRLRHLSVLIWCSQAQVSTTMKRFVRKPGVCMAWGVWDPEVRAAPRWPGRRGESVLEEAEVVVRFLEVVMEMVLMGKSSMRIGDVDGLLAAEVRRWRREQKWTRRGDEEPKVPVFMPNELWGYPELLHWGVVEVVPPEPADVEMVVMRKKEGEGAEVAADEVKGGGAEEEVMAKTREEATAERQKLKNKKWREKQKKQHL